MYKFIPGVIVQEGELIMMARQRSRFLSAALMIAVIVLSACTVPAAPVGEGAEPVAAAEKVLRINLGTFPDMIDPQKSSFVNEIALLKLVYEGLTRQDAALETVPAAAESWTYNDNATMLTFRLRDGLK
ncbi:MAG: hypothetical protein N2545_08525, partial [Thermoflexales bacterium]|nr:hypothetical protein [Thermoflexales bacterium]